jgi:hypothetical protein
MPVEMQPRVEVIKTELEDEDEDVVCEVTLGGYE